MKLHEVTKREAELIRLYGQAKDAADNFKDACQYAALQAETSPDVVRRYIAALASEKANTVIAETEQLMLMFQAMPTLTDVEVSSVQVAA